MTVQLVLIVFVPACHVTRVGAMLAAMELQSSSALRRVPWQRLPLGCVILEWPQIAGAAIPELLEYPVITERLREHLGQKYQFLKSRTVTILDPTSRIELPDVRSIMSEASELMDAVRHADRLKQSIRTALATRPDSREGLARQLSYERSPYLLTKTWVRSIAEVIRDQSQFGVCAWPELTYQTRVSDLAISILTGGISPLSVTRLTVDIGFDVSRSMMLDDRGDYAYKQALSLLESLSAAFSLLRWRLWLVSDSATVAADSNTPHQKPPLATVMKRTGVRAGETCFAPFLTTVSTRRPDAGAHLVILITDGMCSDRSATLRSAERLGRRGSDYLQIVLYRDDDHRRIVRTSSDERFVDNIRGENEITEADRVVERTDEQMKQAADRELGEVTDIAEAAHGGQLVLTYFPLFAMVTLDAYEHYLGSLITPSRL